VPREQPEGIAPEQQQAKSSGPSGVGGVPAGCGMLRRGRFCAVDQGLTALSGYPADELLGRPWSALCADGEQAYLAEPLDLPQGAFAARVRRKDGQIVPIVLCAVPLTSDEAQGADVGLSVFEAAAFNRLERERAGLAAELDGARQQLIRTERLSAIGSLVASIAHQLNNPLCGVLGLIERLARKTDLPPAESRLLDLAVEQGKRMQQLIREVQQFAASGPEVRGVFDLHQTLDAAARLLDKQLRLDGVMLRQEYGFGSMTLTGIEPQIRQALLTLIRACGEALPKTGGELKVQTGREGKRVWIAATIPGGELGSQALGRIAGAECAATRQDGDLGVPVACGIVKAHGGEIRIAATSEQETTMTVFLPVDDREGSRK